MTTHEILEFLTQDTLRAIDWGVLDLGRIKDLELKGVLMIYEASLTLELKDNYKNNRKYFTSASNPTYQQLDIELLRKMVQPING